MRAPQWLRKKEANSIPTILLSELTHSLLSDYGLDLQSVIREATAVRKKSIVVVIAMKPFRFSDESCTKFYGPNAGSALKLGICNESVCRCTQGTNYLLFLTA